MAQQHAAAGYGGDAASIGAANLSKQQDMASAQVLAGLYGQNYNQALGAFQQQQGVGLGAGQANRAALQNASSQFAGLGNQGFNQGLGAASANMGLGQQMFQQGVGGGQAIAGQAQQQFGQGLAAGQAQQGLGQQLYSQGANTAAQQAAIGQQSYGQGLGAAQATAGIGNQMYQQGANTASQQANLSQLGFGQGMAAGQAQQGLGAQQFGTGLAGSQAQMGAATNWLQNSLTGGQAQMAGGTLQQQTQQATDQAYYNQFLQQQGYPFQVAQFLANIAMGTGALSGSTTSGGAGATSPQPYFSDERLKENMDEIGKTHDGQPIYRYNYKGDPGGTQIGLSAQKTEEHHPGAVGSSQGFKTVDYKAATDDAVRKAGGGGLSAGMNPEMAAMLAAQQGMYGGETPFAAHNSRNIPTGGSGKTPTLMTAKPMEMRAPASSSTGLRQDMSAISDAGKTYDSLSGLASAGKEIAVGTAASKDASGKEIPASGGLFGDGGKWDAKEGWFGKNLGLDALSNVPTAPYAHGGAALPYGGGDSVLQDVIDEQPDPNKLAVAPLPGDKGGKSGGKDGTGKAIGSVAGGILGSYFGPAGSMAGSTAGSMLGGLLSRGGSVEPDEHGLRRAREAIAGIESRGSGDYRAMGPMTGGDRAHGRYQVMGKNIGSWTREALGREMTPQQFLADDAAQDKVFDHHFGKAWRQHGNPEDAASVWFSGRPRAAAGNDKDVLGTSVPGYLSKFRASFGGGDGPAAPPHVDRALRIASGAGPTSEFKGGNSDLATLDLGEEEDRAAADMLDKSGLGLGLARGGRAGYEGGGSPELPPYEEFNPLKDMHPRSLGDAIPAPNAIPGFKLDEPSKGYDARHMLDGVPLKAVPDSQIPLRRESLPQAPVPSTPGGPWRDLPPYESPTSGLASFKPAIAPGHLPDGTPIQDTPPSLGTAQPASADTRPRQRDENPNVNNLNVPNTPNADYRTPPGGLSTGTPVDRTPPPAAQTAPPADKGFFDKGGWLDRNKAEVAGGLGFLGGMLGSPSHQLPGAIGHGLTAGTGAYLNTGFKQQGLDIAQQQATTATQRVTLAQQAQAITLLSQLRQQREALILAKQPIPPELNQQIEAVTRLSMAGVGGGPSTPPNPNAIAPNGVGPGTSGPGRTDPSSSTPGAIQSAPLPPPSSTAAAPGSLRTTPEPSAGGAPAAPGAPTAQADPWAAVPEPAYKDPDFLAKLNPAWSPLEKERLANEIARTGGDPNRVDQLRKEAAAAWQYMAEKGYGIGGAEGAPVNVPVPGFNTYKVAQDRVPENVKWRQQAGVEFKQRQSLRASFEALAEVMNDFESGAFSQDFSKLQAKLKSLGLPAPSTPQMDADGYDKFVKNAYNVLLQQTNSMKGPGTDALRGEILSAINNPGLQPAANRSIFGQGLGLLDWQDRQYRDTLQKLTGADGASGNPALPREEFERDWAENNSLRDMQKKVERNTPVAGDVPDSPAGLEEGKKYTFTPAEYFRMLNPTAHPDMTIDKMRASFKAQGVRRITRTAVRNEKTGKLELVPG